MASDFLLPHAAARGARWAASVGFSGAAAGGFSEEAAGGISGAFEAGAGLLSSLALSRSFAPFFAGGACLPPPDDDAAAAGFHAEAVALRVA